MNRTLDKVAAVLAVTIGAMGVFAGGQVLLGGKLPGWNVISWLPAFNFVVGLLAVFVVAPWIWRGSRRAMPGALALFGANAVVLLVLQVVFGNAVAKESLAAMLMRVGVWAIILILMFVQSRRSPPAAA